MNESSVPATPRPSTRPQPVVWWRRWSGSAPRAAPWCNRWPHSTDCRCCRSTSCVTSPGRRPPRSARIWPPSSPSSRPRCPTLSSPCGARGSSNRCRERIGERAAWCSPLPGVTVPVSSTTVSPLHRGGGGGRTRGVGLGAGRHPGLWRHDLISVDRSCATCLHYQPGRGAGRCTLLQADLTPLTLRVSCPEHAA